MSHPRLVPRTAMQPDPTDPTDPPEPAEAKPFFWWCPVCRRCQPFGGAELDRYGRDGWPVCCGHTVFCAARKDNGKDG